MPWILKKLGCNKVKTGGCRLPHQPVLVCLYRLNCLPLFDFQTPDFFVRVAEYFTAMFRRKAFLHWYTGEGSLRYA